MVPPKAKPKQLLLTSWKVPGLLTKECTGHARNHVCYAWSWLFSTDNAQRTPPPGHPHLLCGKAGPTAEGCSGFAVAQALDPKLGPSGPRCGSTVFVGLEAPRSSGRRPVTTGRRSGVASREASTPEHIGTVKPCGKHGTRHVQVLRLPPQCGEKRPCHGQPKNAKRVWDSGSGRSRARPGWCETVPH